MPATVNGVGTHYYGKQDVASRTGTCRSCGAHTTLETYTTRLWFVVVFIPIIPLKRVRLLDYCANCSRHYVVNPEQYEMSRQLAVSGAMEKYRGQPSVDAALGVHAELLAYHMHPEADTFRQEVLEQFPQSADLREGIGSHLDQTGRWTEATRFYEQAFELKEDLPHTCVSLAWRRTNEGKLDEAFKLLDFLRQPGAGQSFNLAQLEVLAKAYQKAGNDERALEILTHLLREVPDAGGQHAFRKLVSKSERALGHSTSILPEKAFSVRDLFDSKSGSHAPWVRWAVFGSIATVLFAVGMIGLNEYQRTHRQLHVVSAFAQPILVSLDGGPPVQVAQRTPFPIAEGRHRISITGPVNSQSEIDLQSNYWSRWTYSPAWIFNVENASIISATTLYYARNPPPPQQTWLNSTEFSFVPHVDYLFQQPADSFQVKGDQRITKVHVEVTTIPPATTLLGLRGENQENVAFAFAEGHLERNPNDAALLNMYTARAVSHEDEQRVTKFLEAGLWRKPISVAWHRAYQNQKEIAANEAALATEYDSQLERSPGDAALLYLRGRVGPDRADQLRFFNAAHQRDPLSGWPCMALAYDEANRGHWPEAREWCDKAVGTLRTDPSFRGLRHVVRMATGEAAAMEGEYRQQLQSQDYTEVMVAIFYLADVLASQNKHDEVRQTIQGWLAKMTSAADDAASFDPLIDYLCGNLDNIRNRMDQGKTGNPNFHFQSLLAIVEPDAAVKMEGIDKLSDEWNSMLAISLSYTLAGNNTEADAWRARACKSLREGDHELRSAADFLERDNAPTDEELDGIVLRISDTPLLLTALAQRFPNRKSELHQRAEQLSISRLPPYLLVRAALRKP